MLLNMNRRGNSHSKNDGLPIINGRKVQQRRRQKFGLEKMNSSKKYSKNSSKNASCCQKIICWIALVVPLSILILTGKIQSFVHGIFDIKQMTEASEQLKETEIKQMTEAPKQLRQTEIVSAKEETKGSFGIPDKCTDAQLALVKKQLPDDPLSFRPWRRAGFSMATVVSDFVYNPKLMREFYASDHFNYDTKTYSFYAVFFRWVHRFAPIDTLAIGSRDPKFNTDQWKSKLDLDENQVFPPVAIDYAAGSRPAKVVVIDYQEQTPRPLETIKTELGYSNDELVSIRAKEEHLDNEKVISRLISSLKPITNGETNSRQPIHYLDLSDVGGRDASILQNLMSLMDQVRYLHFEYNKDGSWTAVKLSSLINELKAKGLVCYFAGKKEADYGLWRITDCFLDYYDNRHWAYVDCVNVERDDVNELASRMEQTFLDTLKKDVSFPV